MKTILIMRKLIIIALLASCTTPQDPQPKKQEVNIKDSLQTEFDKCIENANGWLTIIDKYQDVMTQEETQSYIDSVNFWNDKAKELQTKISKL